MPHRPDQLPVAERVVSCELNLADLDLRPLVNLEDQNHRVARGDSFVLRRDRRELPPVLAQQFLQHHFRLLDARRIERALHRQAHLFLLKAIENVGLGDRVDAFVPDAADRGPFSHDEDDDLSIGLIGRVLHLQFYVLKKLRVPQRLEVAAQRFFVIGIAGARKNAGLQRVAPDAAVPFEIDSLDEWLPLVLLGAVGRRQPSEVVNLLFEGFFVDKRMEQRKGFSGIAIFSRLVGGTRRGVAGKKRERGQQERRKDTTA